VCSFSAQVVIRFGANCNAEVVAGEEFDPTSIH
jgi:hypothetical protein